MITNPATLPAMLPTPSYRIVPLETVLATVKGFEAFKRVIQHVESRPGDRAEFARLLASSPETRKEVRWLKDFERFAAAAVRTWQRAGCPMIERGHAIVSDPGDVPNFVLKIWAIYRHLESHAPHKKSRWLSALPEEVASLVRDIESHLEGS